MMNITDSSFFTRKTKLDEISSKIGSGATPRGGKESYKEKGISLIRSMNVLDMQFDSSGLAYIDEDQARLLNNVTVQKDDILLNITGASVARCCMVPKKILPARVNQHVAIIRIEKTKAVPCFIHYCLVSPRYKDHLLSIAQGGATREALTKENIEDFLIPTPPLPIQRRIASILSAYDDLIENNTRRIQILEEMAQRIYQEWFVNFRFPGHEKVKMVDSELGMIPSGWEVGSFGEIFSIKYGKTLPTTKLISDGAYPVYGAGGIIGRYDEFNVDGPTALVTCRGNGSGTVWKTTERALVTNNSFYITCQHGIDWDFLFIEQTLKHSPIDSVISGSAQPQITIQGISTVKTLVPPNDIVNNFSALTIGMTKLSFRLQRKNQNLRQTRDLLLPKLISGEIDVSDMPEPQEVAAA